MNTALPGNPFSLPGGSSPGSTVNPSGSKRAAASGFADPDPAVRLEVQYARRLVGRLDQSAAEVPHDVSERLRFAREMALQKARLARVAEAAASATSLPAQSRPSASGAARAKPAPRRWWLRIAAVVPLLTLVGGLVLIQRVHATAQIKAAADIDSALLTDDLPPAAYADPAFAEFLKAPRD